LSEQWLGAKNKDVLRHFPPQLILGKQVVDDRRVYVDDSHPLVRVEVFSLDCEYAYSAPTGLFNLQLPHIEIKAGLYQTQSYSEYKVGLAHQERKKKMIEAERSGKSQEDSNIPWPSQQEGTGSEPSKGEEQKEEGAGPYGSRKWDHWKREAPMLLRVVLTNKTDAKDLKVWYRLAAKCSPSKVNFPLAASFRKVHLYAKNTKVAETVMKIDPTKDHFFENLEE
jgi:hypothetical protein